MTPTMRLLVFSNDPLHHYLEKGEVKSRYFNPQELFDEVHVVTFADEAPARDDVQAFVGHATIVVHPLGALRVLLAPSHPTRFLAALRAIDRLVRTVRPSVIRGYNSALEGFLAVTAAQRSGTPCVISLHTDRDDTRAHGYTQWRLRYWAYERVSRVWFEPTVVRRADVLIAVSEHVRRYAQRYGARSAIVLPNRVDCAQFTAPTPWPLRRGRLRVLAVGRLDPPRQQEHLIHAISDLDAELTCIGDGVRRETIASLVCALGMGTRVRMIPSVPHREIQRWYWDADVFAHASAHEGHCHAVAEAMAAGLPVVVNNHASLVEEVGDAGLVVEDTPDAFRDAFTRLMGDPALRTSLGARARDRARRLWDSTVLEAREADVYRSLMGRTPHGV